MRVNARNLLYIGCKLWKTSLYILANRPVRNPRKFISIYASDIKHAREKEREKELVSETSVWSPLTASPSSIYYKDRAASADALSIRRKARFDSLNGRWYNFTSSIARFIASPYAPFCSLSTRNHYVLHTRIIRLTALRGYIMLLWK